MCNIESHNVLPTEFVSLNFKAIAHLFKLSKRVLGTITTSIFFQMIILYMHLLDYTYTNITSDECYVWAMSTCGERVESKTIKEKIKNSFPQWDSNPQP